MPFLKNIVILATLLPLSLFSSEGIDKSDKGYRIPIEVIAQDFGLLNEEISTQIISNHIAKINRKVPGNEALIISKEIIRVSACLQIDPWILTSLIQHESSFDKNAISRTGAVGLTQFTPIGIMEVNDQLGIRGRVGAPDLTTIYFATAIRNCINPSWIDLWNRIDATEENPIYFDLLKEEIKKDITTSITYGVILLKTYLSHVKKKSAQEQTTLSPSEIYFKALVMYNGEPGEAKINYAKRIFRQLKEFYPTEVQLP